jgi:hypothetical protein
MPKIFEKLNRIEAVTVDEAEFSNATSIIVFG